MALEIREINIKVIDMKAQVHKCLESIGVYCRMHIARNIPGQEIRVLMLDENGHHPMFYVNGDGNIWYIPGGCTTARSFDHAKNDNVFDHWEEMMPLIETWPELKQQLGREVAANAADMKSIMNFQI